MVNGVGSGIGRAAIEAALKQMRSRAAAAHQDVGASSGAAGSSFTEALKDGVASIDGAVKATQELPMRVLKGELDFHEVVAQLKESELAFEFSMQVRNKLIDAYREVMRMGV